MSYSAPDYGLDRYSKKRRKGGKAAKTLAAAAIIACCGLGVTGLVTVLVRSEPVVTAQAATQSSTPDTVEEDIVVLPLPEGGSDTVTPDELPVEEGTPDYSEDVIVVGYLDVEEAATAHPLLDEVAPDVVSTGSAGIGISNAPKDLGGTGYANIPAWKNINSDTVGWLKVPGTNINYPIVQGEYTNYYTALGYNKKYSKNGVIWADSANSMTGSLSPNTVLYGHNWTNYGSVPRIASPSDTHFGQLTSFHHLSFAQKHPYIYFSTADSEMQWQIFAAFYTDISFNYINANGGQAVIDGAKARSEHIYDVPVSADDKIVTLSTCTRRFGKSNRQRFVVMAKLVDSASSSVSITANPNPVRPKL